MSFLSFFPLSLADPCPFNPPSVENAQPLSCSTASSGAFCPVICNPGYSTTGAYYCAAGMWVGSVTCVGMHA